ncbi:hypothetical protein QYM36_020046, partial [Artemia franciscana]
NFTMNYWKEKGAASNKLTMGVPLYGQAFTLADKNVNGLNAKATGAGSAGQYTRQAGFLAYYEYFKPRGVDQRAAVFCAKVENEP